MAEYRDSILVRASASETWKVMSDVERWPTWTASMRQVTPLDSPLAVGSRVRVSQPRLPTIVWTVEEYDTDVAFSWSNRTPGVRSYGDHRVTPVDGGTRVDLLLRQQGPLAGLSALLYARLTRRYLRLEAEGLKRRVENPDQG
jgi:uncharacterized membrane protein